MAPQLPQNFVATRRIVAAFVAARLPLTIKPLRPFGNLPSTFPQIGEKCCETQVGGILPMGSVRCPPRRRTSLYSLGADEMSGPPTWRGLSGKEPAPGVPLRPTINCCRATELRYRSHRLRNGNMCFKGFARKICGFVFFVATHWGTGGCRCGSVCGSGPLPQNNCGMNALRPGFFDRGAAMGTMGK